nr:hypothetical protein HK105_005973 [Polyrhizophydium stewartii]
MARVDAARLEAILRGIKREVEVLQGPPVKRQALGAGQANPKAAPAATSTSVKSESKTGKTRAAPKPQMPLVGGSSQAPLRPLPATMPDDQAPASTPWFGGRIAETYVNGFPKRGFIALSDLIDKATLKKACFSTYAMEEEWFLEQVPQHIKLCVARQKPAGSPHSYLQMSDNLLFVFPRMPEFGVMHIKFMVVFMQDFPIVNSNYRKRGPTSRGQYSEPMGVFGRELCWLLKTMGIPDEVIASVAKHDFRNARAHLVHSVPGSYGPLDLQHGYQAVSAKINAMFCGHLTGFLRNAVASFQTASMGSVNVYWLRRLLAGFRGEDAFGVNLWRTVKEVDTSLMILYPSKATVDESRYGSAGAGTIFFDQKYWAKYPKQVLRDSRSTRRGLLQHTKLVLVHRREAQPALGRAKSLCITTPESAHGVMYLGSHNASQSAWGTHTNQNRADYIFKINNWEVGVLFPFRALLEGERPDAGWPAMGMPFEYPPRPYPAGTVPHFSR